MKSILAGTAGLLALATMASAQDYKQSKPFYLMAVTANHTYNGTTFGACHEGAGIEGLCPGGRFKDPSSYTYRLNTTQNSGPVNKNIGQPGILTFELMGSNFNESEPMSLSYVPTSNVAIPLFSPGYDITYVAFDSKNRMNIQAYTDDTKIPLQTEGPTRAVYHWYICETYYGYDYVTLAWSVGIAKPQNPSCQKTDVVRVFVADVHHGY